MLGIPYTTAIDMWSFGCIVFECLVGVPIFAGENENDQMASIMEVVGIPPRSLIAKATRRKVFFDDDYQPILVANTRGKIRNPSTKTLANLMNCQDRDFVDFVDVS
jgi:dual specificity tyrosine-phosphorylation-regulated kinase 2/3/4